MIERLKSRIVMTVLAAACFLASAAAAEDALPNGADIMDNYVKSTGGKEAYQRVKNRVEKGTLTSQGMSMTFTKYTTAPDKLYMALESEMMGKIEQGFDGKTAWAISMMGPQIVEGPQREMIVRQSFFDKEVKWRDIYQEARCVELTDFDGTKCYKVELTPKNETLKEIGYFEKDTFLHRGGESEVDNQMGKVTIINKIKDYKEVDGILYPRTVEQSMKMGAMGQETVITITSVEQNVEISADQFALPEKIKALLEQPKKEEVKEGQPAEPAKGAEPNQDKEKDKDKE